MRLTYLLDAPELCGGVKVVFQHAQLLHRAGHQVTVMANGARPNWIQFSGNYLDRSRDQINLPTQDLVVATWWETVPLAARLALGPVAHFCQGYEGDLIHLLARKPDIEAVYRCPLPILVVAPHLGELIEARFGRAYRLTPAPLDALFRSRWRWRPRRVPQIVIPGIFEAEVKGIPTALAAITRLREMGQPCRVIRLSVLPLSEAEKAMLMPDRYLCQVAPVQVARLLRDSDLLFFPALAMEGFGLPVLEALAAKLPVIASDIPSMHSFKAAKALVAVPPGDAEAFAVAAHRLLQRPDEWRALRQAGARVAQTFHPDQIIPQLVESLTWAAQANPPG